MRTGITLVVASVALLASCSEDDAKKADGTGGTGGATGGSGGATGGSGAAAGSGGTAGSGGNAGSGGASGGAAGVGGSSDGGLTCPGDAGSQWRDWAATACKPCPATKVVCKDFTGSGASWNVAARKLTLVLGPGLTEVASATLSATWSVLGADGGTLTGTITNAAFTVDKNTLTVDLSADIPAASASNLYGIWVKVTDACGEQSTLKLMHFNSSTTDAGTMNVFCEQ
ncbi:MAG: hypothetical protein IT377_06015 [Polyangiaceae bacterium]|nr:hypothetical protein [Polyangiaceae bacterium]